MRLTRVIIALLILGVSAANSGEISRGQARQIAEGWIAENFAAAKGDLPGQDELTCTDIERGRRIIAYLFEAPEVGFVLVAGDDRFGPVIAYSEKNGFDPDTSFTKAFLDSVYSAICEGSGKIYSSGSTADVGKIGPLVETQWDQGSPYNNYCPTTYCTNDECTLCIPCSTPVGCVAVAMGQVMRYYRYPPRGVGSHEYEWTCEAIRCIDGSSCGEDVICAKTTIYVNFEINHDWSNMPVTLDGSSSDAQIDAVSKFLYHCGVAVDMDYGCFGSGAYSADVRDALRKYFNYQSSAEYTGRDFDSEKWFSILTEEIIGGRPVYYRGSWGGGHAFVLDGVDDTLIGQLWVHLNYGWGGSSDGWYDMNFFYMFTLDHAVILGIQPREGGWTTLPNPTAPNAPGLRPQSGGNCFVVTAVYGCPCRREVRVLSAFRDSYLLTNAPGRFFVKNYYRLSPRLVRTIRNKPLMKRAVRLYLKPFVLLARLLVSDR